MNMGSVVQCFTRLSTHRPFSASGLLKPCLNSQNGMNTNNPRLSFSLLTTTLPGGSALAANWTLTDLGALGAPGNAIYESRAYNINNAGQVANGTTKAHTDLIGVGILQRDGRHAPSRDPRSPGCRGDDDSALAGHCHSHSSGHKSNRWQ